MKRVWGLNFHQKIRVKKREARLNIKSEEFPHPPRHATPPEGDADGILILEGARPRALSRNIFFSRRFL